MKGLIGSAIWIAGIILAKGIGWTILAVFFPVYGAYLVVMKTLLTLGWIS